MKIFKAMAIVIIFTLLSGNIALAVTENTSVSSQNIENNDKKFQYAVERLQSKEKTENDPVKALQGKKDKIAALLKEGKISKEEADKITKNIDEKIKEIEKFNALPLDQKKQTLKSKIKSSLDQKVKEGKLSQSKADEIYKKFSEKIEKWDGNGYPRMGMKKHDKKGETKQ